MSLQIIEGENTVVMPSQAHWRTWLGEHHAQLQGIWLIIYHKKSGVPSVYYPEAVDEAICFGWIDSLSRKRDGQSYYQYFSVRSPKSKWSQVNKDKVAKLEKAGLMMPAGARMVTLAKTTGTWDALNAVEALEIPDDLAAALAAYPLAAANFEAFPKSAKRGILEWIAAAKQPHTRQKRVQETATKAQQNLRAQAYAKPKS